MEIQSAQYIFNQTSKELKEINENTPLIEIQLVSMRRYAEQYIDLAASYVDANKEQILNIKNQIK